jgi:hypothetical protein
MHSTAQEADIQAQLQSGHHQNFVTIWIIPMGQKNYIKKKLICFLKTIFGVKQPVLVVHSRLLILKSL